ncbi:DUF1272 domain-containing protein [Amphibacillus marinus]|uniref:DUF1272 domain-containing protein n=1 Tax=Amphibacillus marinus TaxID=872970 RepID=UPI000B887513|nr:DUF1272 domain-containing protein [Amphibacillus marinus]
MLLNLKSTTCEKCNVLLKDTTYSCGHGCMFCSKCSDEMKYVCPNCNGELVRRAEIS